MVDRASRSEVEIIGTTSTLLVDMHQHSVKLYDHPNHKWHEWTLEPSYEQMYTDEINHFFDDWDFLLTPAVSVAAFPAERLQPEHWPQHPWDWLSWAEFSYPFNLSQNPAASVPCGFTRDGLPVGLQIVGRRFDDLGVLQMSAAFEATRPWADKRPPID